MKFLKKIASKEEAVVQEYNVIYAIDTEVVIKKQVITYTITFSDWDGSVLSQTTYNEGETVTVPSNPTRTGYTFTGWSPTIVPTAVADATYVAEYEEKVNIKLYYSNGTVDKYKTETVMTSGLTKYKATLVAAEMYDGVTSIDNKAFSGCSNLTSVTIPNSVTSIGDRAFYGCSGLTSVIIPDSVTSIGFEVFYKCSSLTSVIIPDSVTSIGTSTFYLCPNLTSVTIPNSVTSIGYATFEGCSKLTSVTIPNSVTSIGDRAFYGCSSLTSVTIPDSVTSIGDGAFWNCSNLVSVTIPDSVTSICQMAFRRCIKLTSITYNGTKEQWNSITIDRSWRMDVSSGYTVHCTDGDINI